MPQGRILGALLAGCLAVLALPALALYDYFRPEPWNPRVRFESVRYEAAGLVFTYIVENRTRHTVGFRPGATAIRAVQEDGHPPVVTVPLPLELEPHSSQRVEVRLELSLEQWHSTVPSGQTEAIFGDKPAIADGRPPTSPLPLRSPPEEPAPEPTFTDVAGNALRDLEGFELVDSSKGIRILFPRAW